MLLSSDSRVFKRPVIEIADSSGIEAGNIKRDHKIRISNDDDKWFIRPNVSVKDMMPMLPFGALSNLPVPMSAGYVNYDKATFKAFDADTLIDIIKDAVPGDTAWVAKTKTNDWDILKLADSGLNITGTFTTEAGSSDTRVVFNSDHGLVDGSVIQLPAVYDVHSAPIGIAGMYVASGIQNRATMTLDLVEDFTPSSREITISASNIAPVKQVYILKPGEGYSIGDIITLVGGISDTVPATAVVEDVSETGAILHAVVEETGMYAIQPGDADVATTAAAYHLQSAKLLSGGTRYNVGDTLIVPDGTGQSATIGVNEVDGDGTIVGFEIAYRGSYLAGNLPALLNNVVYESDYLDAETIVIPREESVTFNNATNSMVTQTDHAEELIASVGDTVEIMSGTNVGFFKIVGIVGFELFFEDAISGTATVLTTYRIINGTVGEEAAFDLVFGTGWGATVDVEYSEIIGRDLSVYVAPEVQYIFVQVEEKIEGSYIASGLKFLEGIAGISQHYTPEGAPVISRMVNMGETEGFAIAPGRNGLKIRLEDPSSVTAGKLKITTITKDNRSLLVPVYTDQVGITTTRDINTWQSTRYDNIDSAMANISNLVSGDQIHIDHHVVDGSVTSSKIDKVTVVSGGTGYVQGDILTLIGGQFTSAATVEVLTVGGTGDILTAVVVKNLPLLELFCHVVHWLAPKTKES